MSLENTEIERKFIVVNDEWKKHVIASRNILQAYLTPPDNMKEKSTIRVRINEECGAKGALITLKENKEGMSRGEVEFQIPVDKAEAMMAFSYGAIERTRHIIELDGELGLYIELDEFHGKNEGLVLAEVELPSEDTGF